MTESTQAEVPPPDGEEGKPATSVITPAGIVIEYWKEPKRKYTVRNGLTQEPHQAIEVPSVTTVLECLDKPALPWWGMKTGLEALRTLVEMELLTIGFNGQSHGFMRPGEAAFLLPYINEDREQKDALVDLVSEYKLTTNHVKAKAADRGTSVHNFLEAWCAIGAEPDVNAVPWEEKGYVLGLKAFLADAVGLEPEMMEVTVASIVHGYAGRFDLLAKTTQDMRVVTKIYPRNPPKYTTVPAGKRLLIDLKTSKDIYPTHLLQLEAYEGGLVECGYGPTDARAVLHVTAAGRYEFRQAKGTLEDYVAIVHADAALKRTKAAMKL